MYCFDRNQSLWLLKTLQSCSQYKEVVSDFLALLGNRFTKILQINTRKWVDSVQWLPHPGQGTLLNRSLFCFKTGFFFCFYHFQKIIKQCMLVTKNVFTLQGIKMISWRNERSWKWMEIITVITDEGHLWTLFCVFFLYSPPPSPLLSFLSFLRFYSH